MSAFRDCAGCSACCEGGLHGIAHGNPFGPNQCVFLDGQRCAIYDNRPDMCVKYQCAWSQGIFGELLNKPSESNMLISVENASDHQFLRCVVIGDVSDEDINALEQWATDNNTYVIQVSKPQS